MTPIGLKKRRPMDNGQGGLFSSTSGPLKIRKRYLPTNDVTLYHGDCLDLLRSMPPEAADLVVTSPPYNIGKEYERKLDLPMYVEQQTKIIRECIRVLSRRGSICWQVGRYLARWRRHPSC